MAARVTAKLLYSRWLALLSVLGLCLGCLGFGAVAAQADQAAPQQITLSPSSVELSAPPGGSTTGTMSVINGGSSSFNFTAYADPYHVVGVDYDPSFSPLPGTTDPSGWVRFDGPTSAAVAPGQSAKVNYTLVVPQGTAPGGYYAVLFAETQPPAGGGVTSHSRVGDILYITVQGPVTQSGSLKALPQSHFIFGSSVPLATEVENTGGLHFVTNVKLTLANYFGTKTVFSSLLQRYVLPQTTRKITTATSSTAAIGLYKVEASASILGQTQTLPSRWVVVIHPAALWALPIIVVLVVIYFRLPKRRSK